MHILENCVNCNSCEIACSYYNLGKFQPSRAALKITPVTQFCTVELCLKEDESGRFACSFCEERPCAKYCSDLKSKQQLLNFIAQQEATIKAERGEEE